MKKVLCTAILFCALTGFVFGQSVCQITPNPASISGPVDSSNVVAEAHITNLTGNIIHMRWDRIVINLTPGCETAVCDPITCYARHIDFRNFNMTPNETDNMLVHFYNNGFPCSGIIHVKVTNLDNLADTTIGVYLYNQTSGTKNLLVANVKLFPNPATEYFSLENAENVAVIKIFALDGREAARFDASTKNYYSLQSLTAGNYVLALEDKNGQAFQAMALTKQ